MKFLSLFAVVLSLSLLSACENTPPPEKHVADKLAKDFMVALHKQDYDAAFSMVSDEFYSTRSRAEWEDYFREVASILGKNETMRLKNSLNDTRFSGQFFMYEYVTKYENGLGKELITMIHKINTGNAPLKIFSYKIDSSKLVKLNKSR